MNQDKYVNGTGRTIEAPKNELIGRIFDPSIMCHHFPHSASLNRLIIAGEIIQVINAGNKMREDKISTLNGPFPSIKE